MNRDLVGFFVSVGLLFFGYVAVSNYYGKPTEDSPVVTSTATPLAPIASPTAISETSSTENLSLPDATPTPVAQVTPANPSDLVMELPYGTVHFSQTGGCVGQVLMKNYKETLGEPAPALLSHNYALCKAMGTRVSQTDTRDTLAQVERLGPTTIRFTQTLPTTVLTKTFDLSAGEYRGLLDVQLRNSTTLPQSTILGIELGATSDKRSDGWFSGNQMQFHEVFYYFDDAVERHALPFEDNPQKENVFTATNISPQYLGSGSLYFVTALLPRSREAMSITAMSTGFNIQRNRETPPDRTVYEAWADLPVQLAPNESKSFQYDLYMGPKSKETLDKTQVPTLRQVIDYGFFKIVAWPIYYGIEFLHRLVNNWGLAIVLFTIAIKLLFYPLTVKAYIAGKKMQKLQPQMNAIKEKYKDDRMKQQQEMMALMQQSGGNPLSGCLPVLPQIPVFFALFTVLQHTFELRHAPFVLWVRDLSAMDPYYLLPILLALLMFIQQKLTPMPTTMDPAQQKMMQFLPIIFALFMFTFPSGLVLYSLTNTAMTIVQQRYMMRKHKDV